MTLTSKQTVTILGSLSALAILFFLFSFFYSHSGLPTGDSQKSIIWAQQILETRRLPDYQAAIPFLNRDPVDFYTPALHLVTAGLLVIGGLPAVGISAIIFSILTAVVAAAIAYHVAPPESRNLCAILAFVLVLTQERFLRYIREPGYHYQNIVGELLLFTMLLLALHLLERWRWSAFVGLIMSAAILLLTHQFSAFLAAFAAFPLVVTLAFRYRRAAMILIPFVATFLVVAIPLSLNEKIPHLFTTTPHLLHQVPSLARTLSLMGAPWILLGLAGLITLAKQAKGNLFRIGFIASTLVLLALSQGPRLGIDIPPVRALLYSAVPLSITGAFFAARFAQTSKIAAASLAILIGAFATQSLVHAFTLSHTIRTNSTLTVGQLELIQYLGSQPGAGTLVDDYNRRSASWLVLSGHPMYTRIAADLETQMNEARQSSLRYQLYLNQLDYEKIFSLGSLPEITQLLEKQNISWITGINGSSASHFSHNPALQEVKKVDDITLYAQATGLPAEATRRRDPLTQWLLKPSTLANDIGDLEDVFEHLPASLRATRLSEPLIDGNVTFRRTTAPRIPLKFNVGDYVRVLWDQDKNGEVDSSLELWLRFRQTPASLTLTTRQGKEIPMPASDTPIKISAADAPIDEDGFITLTVNNRRSEAVEFDLIALGLAHTP